MPALPPILSTQPQAARKSRRFCFLGLKKVAAKTLHLPPESARALDYLAEEVRLTLVECERELGRPIPECDRPAVERSILVHGLLEETRIFVRRLRASVPICPN